MTRDDLYKVPKYDGITSGLEDVSAGSTAALPYRGDVGGGRVLGEKPA